MTQTGPLMTYPDLAAYLQMTERSLRRLVARKAIPFKRMSGWWIRFDRSEIDAWLQKETRRPKSVRHLSEA